ncbi:MAG: hypothetical protein IPJ47_07215 [Anaerolineales bacterium]|nr:hypothetical protein [Anaerolineales bacterium]
MTAKQMHENPVEILQRLIQFNTTNPPRHEAACGTYVRDLLTEAGIESTLLAKVPDRPNLIASRLRRGQGATLAVISGLMDVVTAESQPWQQPHSKETDRWVCVGRGALICERRRCHDYGCFPASEC